MLLDDKFFLKIAFKEAIKAYDDGEVPVGAVLVLDNKIVVKCHNMVEKKNDSTAHAEILAISQASSLLSSWRLNKATLYTTLEPCAMCAGAIINSRIRKIVIGAPDLSFGCCGSIMDLLNNAYLNTSVEIKWLYDEDCSNIISKFFQNKRKKLEIDKSL